MFEHALLSDNDNVKYKETHLETLTHKSNLFWMVIIIASLASFTYSPTPGIMDLCHLKYMCGVNSLVSYDSIKKKKRWLAHFEMIS